MFRQGISERQYAAHVGLSRGAIQKAKAAERLVLYPDGSINAAASDARRAKTTDPSKTRKPPAPKLKPVPEAAVAAVGDTLREQGLAVPAVGGGTTFLQAKTANEVLKAQERRIRLQKLKGELVDRARAETLMFRLAREERDACVTWPARVAALMAAELKATLGEGQTGADAPSQPAVTAALMQRLLETHVCASSTVSPRSGQGSSEGLLDFAGAEGLLRAWRSGIRPDAASRSRNGRTGIGGWRRARPRNRGAIVGPARPTCARSWTG